MKVPTPVTPNVPPTVASVPMATVPAVMVVVAVPELIVKALLPDVSMVPAASKLSTVLLNIVLLLILNTFPAATFQCSLEDQLSLALSQIIVLFVSPLSVRPPPSAVTSVGVSTLPNSIFLSSTLMVVLLTVVVVPST